LGGEVFGFDSVEISHGKCVFETARQKERV
jgi:phosphosulfolactate synthase (CoM biosynthesis protein A)